MDCICEAGYTCSLCAEKERVLREFELTQEARDFALEYVGWFAPEPKAEEESARG